MRLMKLRAWSAVAAAVLFMPVPARAQSAPSSFADLSATLEPGQTVVVTDLGGRRTRGDVLDLGDSFMTLRVRNGWGGEERRRFDESGVTSIRRADSIWNGLLIGLGVGVVASEVWRHSECGPRGYDTECSAIVSGVGVLTMVPAGAVAGAFIDKFIGTRSYTDRAGA